LNACQRFDCPNVDANALTGFDAFFRVLQNFDFRVENLRRAQNVLFRQNHSAPDFRVFDAAEINRRALSGADGLRCLSVRLQSARTNRSPER
jgi:hypothetical protein